MSEAAEDRPYLLINSLNHLPGRLCLWLMLFFVTLMVSCKQSPPAVKDAASPTPTAMATPIQYPSPVIGQAYRGSGVVKIINIKEGWIEIDHEEIPGLMPAMEMEYWVKKKSLLKQARVGDRVDFVVVEIGKGEYLTELTRRTVPRK
jgi:Cu/Ag efflux protein CusF